MEENVWEREIRGEKYPLHNEVLRVR